MNDTPIKIVLSTNLLDCISVKLVISRGMVVLSNSNCVQLNMLQSRCRLRHLKPQKIVPKMTIKKWMEWCASQSCLSYQSIIQLFFNSQRRFHQIWSSVPAPPCLSHRSIIRPFSTFPIRLENHSDAASLFARRENVHPKSFSL